MFPELQEDSEFLQAQSLLPMTSGMLSNRAHPTIKAQVDIRNAGRFVHNGDFVRPFTNEFNTLYRRSLLAFAESIVSGGNMTPAQALAHMEAAFDNARALGR